MYLRALARYGEVLVELWPAIALGAGVAASWAIAPIRERVARVPYARPLALAVTLAVGLTCAWRLRWFADDAFISLHYARNWIEGHGLVYNPGERVEGYTNFLWLALVAGCGRLGLDMPLATLALNLGVYAATVALVHRAARQLAAEHVHQELHFSFAAAMTALSYPMVSFATGGLETMFCALLVLGAALAAHRARPLAAGVLAIAATMGHPDHALFYVSIAVVLFARALAGGQLFGRRARARFPALPWWRRPALRALAAYAAPFLLLYVPYFLLRWSYYGDLLPNTFYTKSGGASYYTQGLRYVWVSLVVAGALGALPAFVLGARLLRGTALGQITFVSFVLYLGYVIRLGGDFMTGRLLVSVLPLLFLFAELGARGQRRRPLLAALLAAPFTLACLPTPLHPAEKTRWYLTDERTFWQIDELYPMTLKGETAQRAETLHKYFPDAGTGLRYAVFEIGYMAWRTRFHILDIHGLVDRELAHMPLPQRGRPGHEREASREYVRKKGAALSRKPLYAEPYWDASRLLLDGIDFYLAQYREELLGPLRGKPGVAFTDMPRYLDDYAARVAALPAEQFAADLAFFDAYYFSVNHDPKRRARLLAARAQPAP